MPLNTLITAPQQLPTAPVQLMRATQKLPAAPRQPTTAHQESTILSEGDRNANSAVEGPRATRSHHSLPHLSATAARMPRQEANT